VVEDFPFPAGGPAAQRPSLSLGRAHPFRSRPLHPTSTISLSHSPPPHTHNAHPHPQLCTASLPREQSGGADGDNGCKPNAHGVHLGVALSQLGSQCQRHVLPGTSKGHGLGAPTRHQVQHRPCVARGDTELDVLQQGLGLCVITRSQALHVSQDPHTHAHIHTRKRHLRSLGLKDGAGVVCVCVGSSAPCLNL
jgi:hypothetical protein